MADDSSKLKAQIAFLTDLIKSHKQTTRASVDRRHVSAGHSNNNNNTRSFSWQRSKQPGVGKQHVGTSRDDTQSQAMITKSSYSLDRRKTTNNSSGLKTMTATSSLKAPAIPGSSGLHPVLTMKNVKPSAFNDQTAMEQTASVLSSSKPTVSSRTTTLPSPAVSPIKSSNMTQSVASLAVKKNPYVLNKKGSLSVSSLKPIAQKSVLKWSKSSATNSVLLTDDGKSHSDLELYTKKTSSVNTGQPSSVLSTKGKSPALIQYKVRPSSNVQGAFKWSKLSRISNNPGEKKSGKKPKLARSKLKWTNPGINSKSGTKMQGNPYVLNKGNLASGSTTQKQGIAVSKTISKHKLTKKAVYSAPGQSSLVWRAPGTLKLDRRKVQSTMASVNKKASIRRPSAGFMERRQRAVLKDSPVVTRYSVVRLKRKQAPIKAQKLNKVVVIGGVPYKTSSNKLTKTKATTKKESESKMTRFSRARKIGKLSKTVTIQGEKFIMDSKGKSLQRVNRVPQRGSMSGASSSKQSQVLAGRRRSSNGRTIVLRTPTTLVRSKVSNSQTKTVASRVLRRSIHNARLYIKNKQKPASEQYCMFYNRFGKCNKRGTCPYIHDPSKIAVCTKFLRGRCKNIDGTCPFSHKIDRDKMPVCQFFLRGKCTNDNCPYSHVNVSKKAAVCEDFLKGFCPLGQQCNKKHTLECEEFSRTGKCTKGSKCKLMHRTRKPAGRKRKTSPVEEEGKLKLSRLDFTNDEGFMPLTASVADSEQTSVQEPLENTPDETKQMAEPLVIRPRFLKTKEPEK